MTENDPSAENRPGMPAPGNAEHGGWPQSEPNPWSAQGQASQESQADRSYPAYQASQSGHAHSGYPYQANPQTQTQTYPAVNYPPPAPAADRRSGSAKLVAGVAALALLVGGGAGAAGGYLAAGNTSGGTSVNALDQPQPAKQTANAPAGSVESVASKLMPSVVQLQIQGQSSAGEGSGFIISSDGYILTNNHVIEGAAAGGGRITVVFQNGNKATGTVVGRDPTTDIAVVKAENQSGLPIVEFGRSDDLKVGQSVVAIGSPFELAGTVTSGIVSSLHRPVSAGGGGDQTTVMDAIQTDAAINPGNSGGPLANMSGQVIGINSAIYSPNSSSGMPGQQSEGGNVGIGFAIPIDQARRTADDIIESGHATQTYIGATVGDAPSGGAAIGDVQQGSPAEKAGLKGGDVVTKMDDRNIEDADSLVAAIRTRAPGEKVTFTLANGDTLQCTLGGQPVGGN